MPLLKTELRRRTQSVDFERLTDYKCTNLITIKKIKIMRTVKFLAPNQCYFYADGKIVFQSYETIVCIVENYENGNHPTITITDGQPESKTTAKYLNIFLMQILGVDNYKDLKKYGY